MKPIYFPHQRLRERQSTPRSPKRKYKSAIKIATDYGRRHSMGATILHSHHMTLTCHLCLMQLHSAGVCILFHQGRSHWLLIPQEQTGTGNCSWQQHSAVEIFCAQVNIRKIKVRGAQRSTQEHTGLFLLHSVTNIVFIKSLKLISAIN